MLLAIYMYSYTVVDIQIQGTEAGFSKIVFSKKEKEL